MSSALEVVDSVPPAAFAAIVIVPAVIIVAVVLAIYWCCPCCRRADRARRLERHAPQSPSWVPDIHKPRGFKTVQQQEDLENNSPHTHFNHALAPPPFMSRI